jgi:hypothetical protein
MPGTLARHDETPRVVDGAPSGNPKIASYLDARKRAGGKTLQFKWRWDGLRFRLSAAAAPCT